MEIWKFLGRRRVEETPAVSLDRFDCEQVLDLRADDARFSTEIGSPSNRGTVYTFRPNGYLIYGPYIDLDPGRYVIEFSGEIYMGEKSGFAIEVVANAGATSLASRTVHGDDELHDFGAVEFDLETEATYVEIRIRVENAVFAEFDGLKINRVVTTSVPESKKIFDNGTTVGTLRSGGFGRLAIVFYPMNSFGMANELEDWKFWAARGYDTLSFRQRRDNWYQDVASFRGSRLLSQLAGYKERVAFGTGMGGYAALYFGSMLGVQKVMAFSPQYSVDKNIAAFENRWRSKIAKVGISHRWDGKNFAGSTCVLFDPRHPLDRLHLEKLKPHFASLDALSIPCVGHLSLRTLSDGVCFDEALVAWLEGKTPDVRALKASLRLRSRHYRQTLILHAARSNVARADRLLTDFLKKEKPGVAWTLCMADRVASKAEQAGNFEVAKRVRDLSRRLVLANGIVHANKPPVESWTALHGNPV